MAKNVLIKVTLFGQEVGSIGWDENRAVSYFQYHPDFLSEPSTSNWVPQTGVLKRVQEVQVFSKFNHSTFRGLPPVFADSLPDVFGNLIFKNWLEASHKSFGQISILEQLSYVGNRGMGALEYFPIQDLNSSSSIDLSEIEEILKQVLGIKKSTSGQKLDAQSLLNVFKIGSSAGGVRPKILIAQNKKSGMIIPGDIEYSNEYDHYIVKLNLENEWGYNRELVEYIYYLSATGSGVEMMSSSLLEGKHFATKRFDRKDGKKQHMLTATGITGWDFKDPEVSSYENLFELCLFLQLTHREIEQMFRRMVFNVVFANHDDHLKNHSFIYVPDENKWALAPAYDLTFSLNPMLHFTKVSRALSIGGKRADIGYADLKVFAKKYTVKEADNIIDEIISEANEWEERAQHYALDEKVIHRIKAGFNLLGRKN